MTHPESKLAALYEHHASHGPSSAFVNVMMNGETLVQFIHDVGEGHGLFNVTGLNAAQDNTEALTAKIQDDSRVEFSDYHGDGTDLLVIEELTTDELVTLTGELLSLDGLSLDDLTFAEEVSCPEEGRVTWDDVAGTADPKPVEDIENVEGRVLAVYEYLQELDDEVPGGVPDPFPEAHFYVGQEKLAYVFCPGVHSIVSDSGADRDVFRTTVESFDQYEVSADDAEGVSAIHYGWTPEAAFEITDAVFEELLDYDLTDVTYVEVVEGEDTHSWEELSS